MSVHVKERQMVDISVVHQYGETRYHHHHHYYYYY